MSMSNGGVEGNSPRHSRMVRTWRRFWSSTYATMHSTRGRSPSSISYSKSTTVTLRKQSTGSGRCILGEGGGDHGELVAIDGSRSASPLPLGARFLGRCPFGRDVDG